jgi:hypothetical protein
VSDMKPLLFSFSDDILSRYDVTSIGWRWSGFQGEPMVLSV